MRLVGARANSEHVMPTNRESHGAVLDVPLRLEEAGGSQSSRVHAGLRAAILDGRLAAGLRLPIDGAEAIMKSWPNFFTAIKPLGAEVEDVG